MPASLHCPGLKLAGLILVGAISEILADDGKMMRLPGLIKLGKGEAVNVITFAELINYLNKTQPGGDKPLAVDP